MCVFLKGSASDVQVVTLPGINEHKQLILQFKVQKDLVRSRGCTVHYSTRQVLYYFLIVTVILLWLIGSYHILVY